MCIVRMPYWAARSRSSSESGGSCLRGSGCARRCWRRAARRPARGRRRRAGRASGRRSPAGCWPAAGGSAPAGAAGKTSMMRSMVCAASLVCRVVSTRWPVSAAVIAVDMLSKSRISPTRITSGILAQHVAQRRGEARRVRAQLALVDQALLVLVQELDRVFDGDDVAAAVLVDVVDHRRQAGGLAAAGGAGDEDDAARAHDQVLGHGRQPQLLDRLLVRRHGADRRRPIEPRCMKTFTRKRPRFLTL